MKWVIFAVTLASKTEPGTWWVLDKYLNISQLSDLVALVW